MRSSEVSSNTDILASQYNNLRKDAEAAGHLLVHQQDTPGLTLKVEPGVVYVGGTRVKYAGGNTPSMAAPAANPRIDLVTINSSGTIAVTTGAEGASPAIPTYPNGVVVLAEVYCRVGMTTILDEDDSTNGYISYDVRPFVGNPVNLAAVGEDVLPSTDNTYDLGSASKQWAEVRATAFYKNGVAVGSKFGGTGADGALSISSGTTTLSFGSAIYLVKNYTTISITGTAKLAFSDPATLGSVAVIKATGNVTISSTQPGIDLASMGAAGGTGGTTGADGSEGTWNLSSTFGKGGLYGSVKSPTQNPIRPILVSQINIFTKSTFPMAGGGGGGADSTEASGGGNGGRGGGGLYLEVGGDINFTGSISVAGGAGSNGTINGCGGGGGGASGVAVIAYNTATATSGTINSIGGAGGNNANGGGTDTSGRGGGGASAKGLGGAVQNSQSSGNNGAEGGGGGGAGGQNGASGGTGGASWGGIIMANTEF